MCRRKTTAQFKEQVNKTFPHREYTVLGKYKNNHTKIKMKHNTCGYIYYATPGDFLEHKNKCPYCRWKIQAKEQTKTNSLFKKEVLIAGKGLYKPLSPYKNAHSKVLMLHKVCGTKWSVTPTDFLDGGHRCPRCFRKRLSLKYRSSTQEFQHKVNLLYPNYEYKVLGEYVNNHTPICIQHLSCGTIFNPTPDSFLQRQSHCPHCQYYYKHIKSSYGESCVKNWLKQHGIKFNNPYYIWVPYNKYPLHLDFYIPKLKEAIEYNGRQHYYLTNWSGNMSFHKQLVKWEKQVLHDQWKENWCRRHNIKLIIIKDARRKITKKQKRALAYSRLKEMF